MNKLIGSLGLLVCLAMPAAWAAPASPDWSQLGGHVQNVLAPLSGEWDRFSPPHKQALLALVPGYDRLDPVEQQRFQARIKYWADLPEEQQALARALAAPAGHAGRPAAADPGTHDAAPQRAPLSITGAHG